MLATHLRLTMLVLQWHQKNQPKKCDAYPDFLFCLLNLFNFFLYLLTLVIIVVGSLAPISVAMENNSWYASKNFIEKLTDKWKTPEESDVCSLYPYRDSLTLVRVMLGGKGGSVKIGK